MDDLIGHLETLKHHVRSLSSKNNLGSFSGVSIGTLLLKTGKMRIPMKKSLTYLTTLCVVSLILASAASAQTRGVNTRTDASRAETDRLTCVLDRPFQIQRFALSCPQATRVLARIADCCIPGDRWRLTGAVVDPFTLIEQTFASGQADDFSSTSLTLRGGGTGPLEALLECSYSGGVNVFPAESAILVQPDQGACGVTMLEVDERIWRAP
jgi:hypothetical protein